MAGAQVALALVGLGAEAERRRHLDEAGTGAEGGRVAGRGEQDAAVGMEPPGQGGHEVLVAALAGHQPVEAVEDAPGRPSPARLRKAPLSTAASELASSPCRGRRPG